MSSKCDVMLLGFYPPQQEQGRGLSYLGYVSEFARRPDLELAGWRQRLPLQQLVHYGRWGNRRKGGRKDMEG